MLLLVFLKWTDTNFINSFQKSLSPAQIERKQRRVGILEM